MPGAFDEAEAISAYLKDKGMDAPFGSLYDEDLRKRVKTGEFDMLIAVGGDGSLLRAGHLCAPCGVPILGVNLGRLGFLLQVGRKDWREYLEKLFSGEAWIENRMMLRAEHIRAGELLGGLNALNEVVVARGQNASMPPWTDAI
jgi:NAD+ kinase